MAGQSRRSSFVEAVINTVIGFAINFWANLVVLPLFGFKVTIHDTLVIGCIFTAISVVRSYVIRRWFNAMIKTAAGRFS